jgi:hypothetical protein
VTGTSEDGRVLDVFAHLLSRALVSQSVSVACCTLFLSAPPYVAPARRCTLMTESESPPETSVNIYLNTWRYVPEASRLNTKIILYNLFSLLIQVN